MNESIKKRVLLEAKTIIETEKTLRDMEQLVQEVKVLFIKICSKD